ncbi:E3 ubiquitin-protein ligase Topors-like isoform X1 [Daktulosphaira vitifoliae]|uniref:E3 ubiquitin-protein ligase Topors-like isoform X1 n=1 Tax=Daktulosphaira vitifoliae TaxID=58002 RepID=UPI0021A97C34|nr:E3 ubiquitin-protein ligase Topors-like isoform X1 [Daktulosphaira vitifoliae]XP_050541732.1 E3 ubiquitin-protein ligase Topors-like isoform X1 [Daktulosphaira vitifoliae]XP_050541733.1 E3 ubiquitin-protein ligase Topors-like isoform X1 [Daktulosphaira vitifoliae]
MSLNIKTEPYNESSGVPVVDLSDTSDDDELAVTKKVGKNLSDQLERPKTPETHCSICLEELNNKCYSDSCWHVFCFECLKRWSTIESSCPLCKKGFKFINHTFTEQGIHETYEVPIQDRDASQRIFLRPFADVNRMNLLLDLVRRNERLISEQDRGYSHYHQRQFPGESNFTVFNGHLIRRQTHGQTMRVRVYTDNIWAVPLPDLSGRFRDCSSAFYRDNPAQMYRLVGFIVRDISAIREIERSEGLRSDNPNDEDYITNIIMQTIINYEIRESFTTAVLKPFLGEYTDHFCHELHNYATSPYDMIDYDRNVRYNSRPGFPSLQNGINTIDLQIPVNPPTNVRTLPSLNDTNIVDSESDSDSIRIQYAQEVTVVSRSTSEDSDIEILSQPFRPVDTYDLSIRDQPSTSTGIRNSLDRPTNRYNLRRRRLFSPPLADTAGCPVHLSRIGSSSSSSRRSITIESSSSDDEATITHQPQALRMKADIVNGKRKKKVKKSKQNKKKKNMDTPSDVRFRSRSRSYSGSSSSSDDTDFRGHISVQQSHDL